MDRREESGEERQARLDRILERRGARGVKRELAKEEQSGSRVIGEYEEPMVRPVGLMDGVADGWSVTVEYGP